MIKRKRKVIAALLVAATVLASGTFAYFNNVKDLGEVIGEDTSNNKVLNITNGHVEITGKINDKAGIGLDEMWSYDVVRDNATQDYKDAVATLVKSPDDATAKAEIALYEALTSSPDIEGIKDAKTIIDMDAIGSGLEAITAKKKSILGYDNKKALSRAVIGSSIKGAITNARPGDAIVLGTAGKYGEETNTGLTVYNKSNITTNIKLDFKRNEDGTITEDVLTQFAKLAKAGWVLNINGEQYNLAELAGQDVVLKGNGNDTTITYDSSALQDKLNAIVKTAYAVAPAEDTDKDGIISDAEAAKAAVKLDIRLELPLLTVNQYQDAKVEGQNGDGLSNGFDITKMFEIVATQENNTGWNVDGSSTTPHVNQPSNENK